MNDEEQRAFGFISGADTTTLRACALVSGDILEAFIENLPDPAILFDNEGRAFAWNSRTERLWSGNAIGDILPGELIDRVREIAESGNPHESRTREEMLEITADGEPRFFLPALFPVMADAPEADQPPSLIVAAILRDETAWQMSLKTRDTLFSSISHDLKTPLTSARLSLYLLSEQKIGSLNETQTELVDSAIKDLEREILTIRSLLKRKEADNASALRQEEKRTL